jgi:L-iditol 2-dehydrogenase
MGTMKAIVYYGVEDIRVEQIPIPECRDDELRAKIDACAVCGTDLKAYKSGNPRIKAPIVMGHEFTGIIDTIGKNVKGFKIGDRIVMATSVSCGECYYCKNGNNNLCKDVKPMGFSYNGGMAEYIIIPKDAIKNNHVIKVPAGIKAEHAALCEPLSCAVNSIENCNIKKGDTVVVSGAGPMGILNLCVAREFGAAKTILSEVSEPRLLQAKQFGVDILVNPVKEDLVKTVLSATDGIGADVVIVAAPAAAPQEAALDIVRKRGTVCLFASLPAGKSMLNIDSRKIHYGELRIVGSSDSTPKQVMKAVELLQSKSFPADKLASHILKFEDIKKAFELMVSGEALRVVLKP